MRRDEFPRDMVGCWLDDGWMLVFRLLSSWSGNKHYWVLNTGKRPLVDYRPKRSAAICGPQYDVLITGIHD